MGNKSFNSLFTDSLREGLSIMLDENAAKSFLTHLEENASIRRDEIAENPDTVSTELERVFGVGAERIESMVAALLYSKLGLRFEKKEAPFGDYVQYARVHGSFSAKEELRPRLDSIDIQIIDSLRGDARKPVLQISKEIGISRPTVISRLGRLIESNVLSLNACLNLSELNYKTSLVALETKGSTAREELEKLLSVCPRVLMLLRPTDKANMVMLVYGEDQNTLNSTIETFRSVRDTDLVYVHNSDPPLFTDSFSLNVFPVKSEVSPCGKKCEDCFRYQEGQCRGCPAVTAYKGP